MPSTFLGEPVLCSKKKNLCAAGESTERRRGLRGVGVWWPCKSSPVESMSKAREDFGYFAFFLNSSKHRSCGSVITNSNDLFISCRVWVSHNKLVYQLQNSSGYSTGTAEFLHKFAYSQLKSWSNLNYNHGRNASQNCPVTT